jgi:hypothetical protein
MIGEACCEICGVFSVKATEHSPGDVQDPSGSTQALASGDSVCLCVSGVRALRHPRQVCMFVCIENRGYRLWRRAGQLGRTRGVQNVSISFASRQHKFEMCELIKVNFFFAGTALEQASCSDGAPSPSSGAGPTRLTDVCVHVLCVRVCLCVLAKE